MKNTTDNLLERNKNIIRKIIIAALATALIGMSVLGVQFGTILKQETLINNFIDAHENPNKIIINESDLSLSKTPGNFFSILEAQLSIIAHVLYVHDCDTIGVEEARRNLQEWWNMTGYSVKKTAMPFLPKPQEKPESIDFPKRAPFILPKNENSPVFKNEKVSLNFIKNNNRTYKVTGLPHDALRNALLKEYGENGFSI